MRTFYSAVLYAKGEKLAPLSLREIISIPWNREMKFSLVIEQFIRSVGTMEDVVLVPTRLLDMEVKDDSSIPDLLSSDHNNLFEVFHLLKKFRDKLQSVAVPNDDEISSPDHEQQALELDNRLYTFSPKAMACDSGLWSLSSASRESIEEDLVTNDGRSSSSCNSEDCSLDSTTMIKQSLHSAKSLCAFLIETTSIAHHIVCMYLQNVQCELCE